MFVQCKFWDKLHYFILISDKGDSTCKMGIEYWGISIKLADVEVRGLKTEIVRNKEFLL